MNILYGYLVGVFLAALIFGIWDEVKEDDFISVWIMSFFWPAAIFGISVGIFIAAPFWVGKKIRGMFE